MTDLGVLRAILQLKDDLSGTVKTSLGNLKQAVHTIGSDVKAKMSEMAGSTGALGSALSALGPVGIAAGAGIGAVTTAIGFGLRWLVSMGSELTALNRTTGISVEQLQRLKAGAADLDIPFEKLTQESTKLEAALGEGSKKIVEALKDIGLSMAQVNQIPIDERLIAVKKALAETEDPAKQASVSLALFGKSWAETRMSLADVSALENAMNRTITLSDDAARAGDELGDVWGELKNKGIVLAAEAVAPLAQSIIDSLGPLTEYAKRWNELGKEKEQTVNRLNEYNRLINAGLSPAQAKAAEATIRLKTSIAETNQEIVTATLEQAKLVKQQKEREAQMAAEAAALAFQSDLEKNLARDIRETNKAIEEAEKAYRDFLAVADAQFEQQKLTADAVRASKTDWNQATDAIFAGGEAIQQMQIRQAALAAGYKDMSVKLTPLKLETIEWGEAMDGVNDFLSETRGLFDLLGVSADSTLGKILGWATKIFDMFNSITGLIGKVMGLFGGAGGGLGGIFGGLGGLGSLFGGAGGVAAGVVPMGVPGAITGVTGGAAAGGLGGLGGALAGFFTNPLTAIIGGGLLGGLGLAKLFGREGSAETTAKAIGIDFGALSKDFQKTLQEMGKELGGFAQALQLNITRIFQEGGLKGGIDEFARRAADTFSFLDRAEISTAQAQQTLNSAIAEMLPLVGQMGTQGVLELERLLAAAQRTGVSFDGMSALAELYVQRANELGIAVNDVVLQALGLEGALALIETGPIDSVTASANAAAFALEKARAAGGGFNPGVGGFDFATAQHGMHRTVRSPTLILAGEAGPERVDIGPAGGGGIGGITMNLHIDASGSLTDANELARKLAPAIEVVFRDQLRSIADRFIR